jgi:6-pyruvoyltetrahydropterin/6-carboxytetrahydropterin synthase
MYTLAVSRDFIASHYLIGGDWGLENNLHSHHYKVEVQLEGKMLDEHGYLVDIVNIEVNLDTLVALYRDKTLNDLPEFKDLNPSIEHFARIFCQTFIQRITTNNLHTIQVKIWENDIAWTGYCQDL